MLDMQFNKLKLHVHELNLLMMQRWTPVCSISDLVLVAAQLLFGCSNGPQYVYGAYSFKLGVGTGSLESVRKRRSLILSLVGCFPWGG